MVEALNLDDEVDEADEWLGDEDSGCCCVECEESVRLTEEVFLLRVVHPFVVNGKAEYHDIIDAQGQYKYEPAVFDFSCWEDEQEELQTLQDDVPPVHHPDGIILCDICESDILQGELMGLLNFGEMRWSERAPNGQPTVVFMSMADPTHLCIVCLTYLEDNRRDPIWPEGLEPAPGIDVCGEGVFERCWRGGACDCPKRICEPR